MRPSTDEFRKTLEEVGVILTSSSESHHVVHHEHALIVRGLTEKLQDKNTQVCSKFIYGMKFLCQKEKYLKKFLIPTKFQKSVDNIAIYQDSLFSIFLKVLKLQDDIIDILLEGITAVAMEETEDTSWLRLMLRPLRCLPTIKNEENLVKRLLDILEISTFTCQIELLDAFPEIFPDSQCDVAAKQLTKLLDQNNELCGAIVDCLTALNLDSSIKSQIHDRILARILAGVPLKVYLILIKFLISDYKSQDLVSNLLKIRTSLDSMLGSGGREKETDKTLIINYLQSSAITQKSVAEGWLNTISNIKNHQDHKPVDLLLIFILHHTSDCRKKIIEAIFRKRVSQGLFKIGLIEKTFEKYMTRQMVSDYMKDIIDMGCYLLRFSKDVNVAKFATSIFENLFIHIYTPSIYRKEILINLISLTGSNDNITINTVLKLILTLVDVDRKKVQTHISLLMQLLEKLDTLEFKDVKIVFDILCSLVCGEMAEDACSSFRDQIFNTVRKQLSCSDRIIKRMGIISAIVMVKHTASVDVGDKDLSSMECSIGNLPIGPPREAAELLELVSCATGDNSELLSLYYDQLASILASDQLFNKYFLYWLYKKVGDDFETMFLTDILPEMRNEMHFSSQYTLNKPEDVDTTFSVNIGGYTGCDENDRVMLLAPYFRVMRLLHYRQHESLSEIDLLLGCGVVLPVAEDPDELDADQCKLVVDCLFHCINWFREIISAFVSEKTPLIQERVVKRLQNLIDAETKLDLFLKQVPGHNLPRSYFESGQNVSKQLTVKVAKSVKSGRKKVKSLSVLNETTNTTVNTQNTSKATQAVSTKKSSASSTSLNIQFREIDTDIIRLIKYPLKFDDEANDESSDAVEIFLNLHQVRFILCDFTTKLSCLTLNKDMGLSHLNDVNPEHLIKDCVRIVRKLNKFVEVIVKKLNKFIDDQEDLYFPENINSVKICFTNILQIYTLIFQWSGFQHINNVDLLKHILKATRDTTSQSLTSTNRLISDFVAKICQYTNICIHLNQAVLIIKIMESLNSMAVASKEIQKKIAVTAEQFLGKRWHDATGKIDHGQQCNQNIDVLVKAYLKNENAQVISGIVDITMNDIKAFEENNGHLSTYPAIDKKNFHVFYLGICNALLSTIKVEIQALTNMGHLKLWSIVAGSMTNLMTIAKTVRSKNLSCFLKKTISILKVFHNQGMPIMEMMFKSNTNEVINILKTMQNTTRFLHSLCCQSKTTCDSSVVAYIPSFKLTIESLIYRVKAALTANNCTSAFWFGNLRNKDIDGEEIPSQSTIVSNDDDSREQMPSDDEDDENIINDIESDNEGSVESEVYDG